MNIKQKIKNARKQAEKDSKIRRADSYNRVSLCTDETFNPTLISKHAKIIQDADIDEEFKDMIRVRTNVYWYGK